MVIIVTTNRQEYGQYRVNQWTALLAVKLPLVIKLTNGVVQIYATLIFPVYLASVLCSLVFGLQFVKILIWPTQLLLSKGGVFRVQNP
jgi:hypothetical protein